MTHRHCFGKLAQCRKYATDHNYNIVEVIVVYLLPLCNIAMTAYSINQTAKPLKIKREIMANSGRFY